MKITVLGGGHGCYAAAVEMAEKNHEVIWWRRDTQALKRLAEAGKLKIKDYQGNRSVSVGFQNSQITLCEDLQQAVQQVALIVIPLPATTHEDLARQIAPYLQEGQVVFLPPGTFGSYIFAQAMKEAENYAQVAFAETGTLPYLVRKHAADQIVVSGYATRLPTGVFPSQLSDRAFQILQQAYPHI